MFNKQQQFVGRGKILIFKQITNALSYYFHIPYLSVWVKTCKSFFLVIDY